MSGGIKYTRQRLMDELSLHRGWTIGQSTFYKWLNDCCISSSRDGYSEQDRIRLIRLCQHLRTGGSVKNFRQQIIQEQKEKLRHDDQSRTTGLFEHPIDVQAIVID